MTNFVPLHDRILVRRSEEIETTRGGIVLPDNAKEKPLQGIVEAVGDGRWEDGHRVPSPVKKGDRIVFGKYAGTEIRIDGEDFLVLRDTEVLGIVSGDVKQVAAA
jgi:chaperonin GroES